MRIPGRSNCSGDRHHFGGVVYEDGEVAARGDQGPRKSDRNKYRNAYTGGTVLRVRGHGGWHVGTDQDGAKERGNSGGNGRTGATGGERLETDPAYRRISDANGIAIDLGKKSASRGIPGATQRGCRARRNAQNEKSA